VFRCARADPGCRGMQGQTDLAAAAGPGQRDQPGFGDQHGQLGQFGVAGHEASQLDRQVVPVGAQRAQRREGGVQVPMAQLPHVLGRSRVRQPAPAEVGQVRARRQIVGHQRGRCL
jgi:hypothetical protein